MSDPAPPDGELTQAFGELSRLVERLGEELGSYRKRALSAEKRVRELEDEAERGSSIPPSRAVALERENAELSERLAAAEVRVERMLKRVRFLKQQREAGA